MKLRVLATAIGTGFVLICAIGAANADTWVFRDTVRPHGHERSLKAKFADARRCGAIGHGFSDAVLPTMQQCMLAHGWALDHIIPDAAPRYAHQPVFGRTSHSRDEDEELRKRNEDASNDAEQQRDEQARSDDFQRQIQDQINNDAAANAQANGQ